MKPEKAIEVGEKTLKANYRFLDPDFRGFIKLGIEALKVMLANRNPDLPVYIGKLPGESEE